MYVSFQQTDLSKLNIVEMNEIQMANYLTWAPKQLQTLPYPVCRGRCRDGEVRLRCVKNSDWELYDDGVTHL